MGYFSGPSYTPGSFSGYQRNGWQPTSNGVAPQATTPPPMPFVEKPDVNSLFGQGVNIVAAAGRAPGYVAERPLAWLDTATANPATGKGLVEDAFSAIRGIPFLGPALGTAGDLLTKASQIPAAILNSPLAAQLKTNYGQPDAAPLGLAGLSGGGQLFPQLGTLLGTNPTTVGELRRHAAARGFTEQDIADLGAGRRDIFSFSDKSTNENEVINAITQLGLDPTNLAFGLGAAGKLPKLGTGVGLVGKFFEGLGTHVPLANELWNAGSDLARDAHLVNYKGFASTVGQMARGAVRVNNAVGVGLTAAELGLNAAFPANPDNTPRSGLLEGLADFARRAQRDQPLSNNNLFSLYAAFKFPYKQTVNDIRGKFNEFHFKASGSNILPSAVDLMVPGPTKTMAARTQQFYQMFGGEKSAWSLIEQVAKSIASDSTYWDGKVLSALRPSNMPELEYLVGVGGQAVERQLKLMLQKNQISGTAWVERAKRMFSNDLREIGDIGGGVSFNFSPDFAAQSWRQYEPVAARLAQMADKRSPIVLGIMKSEPMPLELFDNLQTEFKRVADANSGVVPIEYARQVVFDHPQLLRDEPAKSFFARATTRGAPDLAIADVTRALRAGAKNARPLREFTHEFKDLEAHQAAQQASLTRVRGYNPETKMIDPALAPGVGTATVTTMTRRAERARAAGVKSFTVDSAVQLRSTAPVKSLETNIAAVLEDSGLNVERIHQGISVSGGELVPDVAVTMQPGSSLGTLRTVAIASMEAGAKKVTQQASEAVISMSERDAVAHGLRPNGVEARWSLGKLTPKQANTIGVLLQKSGLRGQFIDTTGMLRVFALRGEEAVVTELSDLLAKMLPEHPATGALKPEVLRSYIEVIVNDGRKVKPSLAEGEVLLSDARTSVASDLRLRAAERSFEERRNAEALAGQSGQPQAGLNGRARAKPGAVAGDRAVVQGRVDAAWAKLESNPTPHAQDKFLEEVANTGDPSLLPDALGVLKEAVQKRVGDGPIAPALDEALLRAENDFISTGGNRGEVLFMASQDAAAESVLPWFDNSMRGLDAETLQKYAPLQRELLQSGSPYTLKTPPTKELLAPHVYTTAAGEIAREFIRPQPDAIKKLFSYGPVSTLAKWQRMILSPRGIHASADASKRELFNLLLNHGATVAQVNNYLESLKAWAASVRPIGDVPLFRSYDALPLSLYKQLAHGEEPVVNQLVTRLRGIKSMKADKGNAMFSQATLDSVEAAGGFGMLIDKSASAWWRGISDAADAPGIKGSIGRRLEAVYPRGFALRHNGGKIFYHAFRFIADPRWWLMNAAEGDILLGLKYGTTGRGKKPISNLAQRYAGETAAQAEAGVMAAAPTELGDAAAALKLDVTGTGWYDPRRTIQARLMRTFDAEAPKSAQRMLDALPADDPIIQGLLKIAPDLSPANWGKQLFDMVDSFDRNGVPETVTAIAKRMFDRDTYKIMEDSGLLQRLHEVNQATWDGIVRTVRGNPSRSVGERLLNSYWLYWPISYQLKAAHWLYDMATNKMFGANTNLGGAWLLSHMLDTHERLIAQDEGYAKLWADNPTSWFVLSMLMPVTPFDIGVSLNPIVRKGLEMEGVFPERKNTPNDPIQLIHDAAKFGPILTYDLWGQIQREPWYKNVFGGGTTPPEGGASLPH